MAFNTTSTIAEDWQGGYKLETYISNDQGAQNWTLNFDLPFKINAVYGIDVVQEADGSYTMKGQSNWQNLVPGQTINPIFIVEDQGQSAQVLNFRDQQNSPTDYNYNSYVEPIPSVATIEQAPVNYSNYTIDVDRDFGGDLAAAIAVAQNGDLVQLGNHTYYTSGITIDKNIILDGQENTVIDGNGTYNSIINLYSGASGATIQDLEITNGNNGISGYRGTNLTLQNLEIHNIGKNGLTTDGNQTGIILSYANGLNMNNIDVYDVDRKGIGIGDTNGAYISNINVQSVNLAANHAQSHDAAGIKFFNTNNVTLKDSYFEKINANYIWNDTTNGTVLDNNTVVNVGLNFLAPSFNSNVDIHGIYNEKSSKAVIRYNDGNGINDFAAFNATEFSTRTMNLEDNNIFSKVELGTTDYWVNQGVEILIAETEDPASADFSLFASEYYVHLHS